MIFRTVKDRNYMIVSNDTYMKDKGFIFYDALNSKPEYYNYKNA